MNEIMKRFYIRPTKLEKIFMKLCRKNNLPFRYVGDGSFWIGNANPDFVDSNGKKICVEIFGEYWHDKLLNEKVPYFRTEEGRKRALE